MGAARTKHAVVVHSGGMDSSLCLALAVREWGASEVLSLSFRYGQRHAEELSRAAEICAAWGVDHVVVDIGALAALTDNALLRPDLAIEHRPDSPPNTLVVGRNGLMARLAAVHAHHLGARCIYMGILQLESDNSGYRDCSRRYMDLMEQVLRLDLDDEDFEIRTPLVDMTKAETMELGHRLGVLPFLLDRTVTCYEGRSHAGCTRCPACRLRNEGLRAFARAHPDVALPFPVPQHDGG